MFQSVFDKEKVDSDRSWQEIVERAANPREYPRKNAMPLIKLARFGDGPRSAEGFLRNANNVISITGVEADYDGERVDMLDALTQFAMAEVRVLLYTSPSHKPDKPRWRVLAPLSVELPAGQRARLVARLNGVCGGVLAAESFVLAQTFYWGAVAGAPYVWAASGAGLPCVNEQERLDDGAVYPQGQAVGATGMVSVTTDSELRDVVLRGVPGEVYRALVSLSARLVGRGMSADDALGVLHGMLNECEWRERDPETWHSRMQDCVGLVATAARRYTDRRERSPPEAEPTPTRRVERVEIVPTGVLIPRSVLMAHEVRLASLDDLPLSKSQAGVVHPSIGNANTIIRATLNGRLWTDASTGFPMNGVRLLSEVDSYYETVNITNMGGGHNFRTQVVMQAMMLLARGNVIDPWVEWLSELQWDGTERLNSMGEDYFGVSVGEDQLERIIFRKLMIGAVARQFNPGCKFDLMIVLEGAQGTRKSTALRTLFGNPYVASWEHDFNTKDFRQQLQGNVCIEVAELAAFQRSEMNAIKSILSETVDVFRPSYGRTVERRPRRCVMVGTSNDDSYLSDVEGNRRFVPVKCGMIEVESLAGVRDQLFAEAVAAYRAGGADARWWELPGRIVEEQALRMIEDPWLEELRGHLIGRQADHVRVRELMGPAALDILVERQHSGTTRRIAGVLRQLGWKRRHDATGNYWARDES
jgi:hypothetical protein